MSRINVNELVNLEMLWRGQVRSAERDGAKITKSIAAEKKKALKNMSDGKTQLAEMHVVRTLELETESANNQRQQVELARLLSQVQDFRKTAERAQAMNQAMKGMGKLEKQMDLGRLTQITDEYKEKIGNMEIARGIFNDASTSSTMVGVPQDRVDELMSKLADEAGVELRQNLESATPVTAAPARAVVTEDQEAESSERLKALRNAA